MALFKRKPKENDTNRFVAKHHYVALRKAEKFADEVLDKIDELGSPDELDYIAKTNEFRNHLTDDSIKAKKVGTKKQDEIIVEAFAYAYKAIQKVYGINLYKVQIMGAWTLNNGDVAEMRTGEGKTLTAIPAAYINALEGKGVHVVTVNEYLSKRDAFNVGKVFNVLGLSVGAVLSEQDKEEKRAEYAKDITYITNSELGFDYLKDNLVRDKADKVQRGFYYAIVDEVDSILIDEARTPLIISGGGMHDSEEYTKANDLVVSLKEDDYTLDDETNQVFLTPSGVTKAEQFYDTKNLFSYENSLIVHRIKNALSANFTFKNDVDYTVKDGEIVLIDVFTGRLLEGRQYSEGLNQAIEAKEGIRIKPETKTFASITYQNLFRSYKKLSGMSGTALPEEEEFINVYNMRVLTIPTNRGVNRVDEIDLIYGTKEEKNQAVVEKIQEIHATGQPILVGTRSVFDSEIISNMLDEVGIKHEVLNAKNHAREADIIASAGKIGAVTISTNMAGRGTDIKLEEGVIEKGGLYVLGTERHESRRIDDQLRGRSGRQGDIGYSMFFVSLEDEIMRRAGAERAKKYSKGMAGEPIKSKMISRALTAAQKRMEGQSYDSRKSVIEYDDVLNNHRISTYRQRDQILELKDTKVLRDKMVKIFVNELATREESFESGSFRPSKFIEHVNSVLTYEGIEPYSSEKTERDEIIEDISEQAINALEKRLNSFAEKEESFNINRYVKNAMIYSLDFRWQNHIDMLSKLRSAVHYRQYAQKNPVQVYLFEAEEMFKKYRTSIAETTITTLFNIDPFARRQQIQEAEDERNTKDLEVE